LDALDDRGLWQIKITFQGTWPQYVATAVDGTGYTVSVATGLLQISSDLLSKKNRKTQIKKHLNISAILTHLQRGLSATAELLV